MDCRSTTLCVLLTATTVPGTPTNKSRGCLKRYSHFVYPELNSLSKQNVLVATAFGSGLQWVTWWRASFWLSHPYSGLIECPFFSWAVYPPGIGLDKAILSNLEEHYSCCLEEKCGWMLHSVALKMKFQPQPAPSVLGTNPEKLNAFGSSPAAS